jgi:hypothetical protein
MKRLSFLLAALLFLTQNALAGPIGPLPTEKQGGKFSLGAGYTWASSKWEMINRTPGSLKLQQDQLYAELGLGLSRGWEIILRGGVADLTVDNAFQFDRSNSDGEDTFRTFGSLGAKGTLYRGSHLTVGPFVQGHYYATYIDRTLGQAVINNQLVTAVETMHVDEWWDVQAGLIAQSVLEGAVLYGGPFYYRGELKFRNTFNGALQGEAEMKEKGTVGALLGVRWPVTKGLSIDLEGQMRSSSIINAALHYHF